MTRPRRMQRIALAIAASGFVALGGVAFAFRDTVLFGYYFYRMRRDPTVMLDLLQGEESDIEHQAARSFLERHEGQAALLRAYLRLVVGDVSESHADADESIESFYWSSASSSGEVTAAAVWWGPSLREAASSREARPVAHPGRAAVVFERLDALEGEELTLPEHAALRFTILRRDRAFESVWMPHYLWKWTSWLTNDEQTHVCRIRHAVPLAAEALVERLGDPRWKIRFNCVEALEQLGYVSDEVVVALEKLVAEIDPGLETPTSMAARTREAALDALEKLRRHGPREKPQEAGE